MEARFACGSIVQMFFEQDLFASALPEANRGVRPGEHRVWNQPLPQGRTGHAFSPDQTSCLRNPGVNPVT
jgi:hypothetical protein